MPRLNIASPEFEYDATDPAGFRAGLFRFGKLLGAEETGCSIYELPPGQAICPYHYEYGEEEWLLVLEGGPRCGRPRARRRSAPGRWSSSRQGLAVRIPCATTRTRRRAC